MNMTKKNSESSTEKKENRNFLENRFRKTWKKGYSKEMIADFLGIDAEMIAEIMNDGVIKASQK